MRFSSTQKEVNVSVDFYDFFVIEKTIKAYDDFLLVSAEKSSDYYHLIFKQKDFDYELETLVDEFLNYLLAMQYEMKGNLV